MPQTRLYHLVPACFRILLSLLTSSFSSTHSPQLTEQSLASPLPSHHIFCLHCATSSLPGCPTWFRPSALHAGLLRPGMSSHWSIQWTPFHLSILSKSFAFSVGFPSPLHHTIELPAAFVHPPWYLFLPEEQPLQLRLWRASSMHPHFSSTLQIFSM